VTGTSLGDAGIWNADDGQQFANLGEGSEVSGVAFSPDGQVLAIGSENGSVMLLRQTVSNPTQRFFVHVICGKVRGNMTQAQWANYVPGQPYQKTCTAYP